MKIYSLFTILILILCTDVFSQSSIGGTSSRRNDYTRKARNMDRASKEAERRAASERRKAAEAKKRAEMERQQKAKMAKYKKAQAAAKKASDESMRKYLELQAQKKANSPNYVPRRAPIRNITQKEPEITLPTEFKDKATAAIEPHIKSMISPFILAKKLKVDFPPKKPTEELESVRKKINTMILEKVDAAFPPSTKDVHYKKALERYPLYKKGDMVENLRIRPAGRNAVVSGAFNGINRTGHLVIGSYEVPKVDMTEKVMVYFDEELNDKKIETYMANKLYYYYEDRAAMKEKLNTELQSAPLNKAGYFELDGKFYSSNDYIKAIYKKESDKITENVYAIVKERLVLKYDFKSTDFKNEEVIADIKQFVSEELAKLPKRKKTSLFSSDFYE